LFGRRQERQDDIERERNQRASGDALAGPNKIIMLKSVEKAQSTEKIRKPMALKIR
jgi:hypothetical protein